MIICAYLCMYMHHLAKTCFEKIYIYTPVVCNCACETKKSVYVYATATPEARGCHLCKHVRACVYIYIYTNI